VELSGMVEHCDFTEQTQVQAGEKVLRPDLVVRMPEARELVVVA
jgi:DNA recombination protein RmuC